MIEIPVSIGELIDKLSILSVKLEKIKDNDKLFFVNLEYNFLMDKSSTFLSDDVINKLFFELCEINRNLWEIEDAIRISEHNKQFDHEFIELARKVYITNDSRFQCKNEINKITNSTIREVKEYVKY